MKHNRRCGDCSYWEPLYVESANLGDHQSGTCRWLSYQVAPMWLHRPDYIMNAEVLAGTESGCRAWKIREILK